MNNDYDPSEVAAEVTRKAIVSEHAQRMTPGLKIPLPQGMRESAAPYLGIKHPRAKNTLILGNAAMYLKKPRPGKYIWRVRDDPTTASMVAAQQITPVLWEELDRSDPSKVAPITELKTPSGDFVLWKNLALFHITPSVDYDLYGHYEDWSKALLAQHAAQFQEDVYEQSRGTYKGVIKKEKVS
jgi:hypothetical protein